MPVSPSSPDLSSLRVLVVDDEADIRLGLTRLLESIGIRPRQAEDGAVALAAFEDSDWDLVLTDLMMPEMTGAELLAAIKQSHPHTSVVLLTGFGTVDVAVQCLQGGAAHFLTKPFRNDEILNVVMRLGSQILARREPSAGGARKMVAEDPSMRQVMTLVEQVAPRPVTVLIEGESGSGKEIVAQSIHRRSALSERPFSAVNCAALSDTLLESELFGHLKGSFTGADRNRAGLFEEAQGGTVFLDEVASMSSAFQGKLLRVLQEKVVRPVGSSKDVSVDFRLIAATNRNLEALVQEGGFREDLYYRLQVVRIHVPPLRSRPKDILPLALHFLVDATQQCLGPDVASPEISSPALARLQEYAWPGNVRELENAMQRAVIVCQENRILPYHLGLEASGWSKRPSAEGKDYAEAKASAVEEFQREFVQRSLEASAGNVSQAADACGLTRAAFQKILKQLGIQREDFSR